MKLKTIVFGLLLLAGSSFGQTYYGQRLGNTDYIYGSNGYQGYEQQFGNQYYYHDNTGNNGMGPSSRTNTTITTITGTAMAPDSGTTTTTTTDQAISADLRPVDCDLKRFPKTAC
jgi:hypothetical protein